MNCHFVDDDTGYQLVRGGYQLVRGGGVPVDSRVREIRPRIFVF